MAQPKREGVGPARFLHLYSSEQAPGHGSVQGEALSAQGNERPHATKMTAQGEQPVENAPATGPGHARPRDPCPESHVAATTFDPVDAAQDVLCGHDAVALAAIVPPQKPAGFLSGDHAMERQLSSIGQREGHDVAHRRIAAGQGDYGDDIVVADEGQHAEAVHPHPHRQPLLGDGAQQVRLPRDGGRRPGLHPPGPRRPGFAHRMTHRAQEQPILRDVNTPFCL